jgi:HEAT repeat protein
LLHDSLLPVRASAAYALKRCGRQVDLAPLADLLADQSPRWRAHAAYMLGKLGDRSALPMLEDAVRDPFPRVSGSEIRLMELQVAEARVRLGDDEAIQSIRAALFPARSEDLEATALAAQLTGELNDRASARELVMLTRMRDDVGNLMPPEVRLAAAGSLASLRVEQAAPDSVAREFIADRTPTVKAQAAFVLGQSGRRENLEALEGLLTDANASVKVTAAAAILKISDPQGSARAMR